MRHPNRSWRVDETDVKVAGSWAYLYRAVDSAGETIEFMCGGKRTTKPGMGPKLMGLKGIPFSVMA
jgi:transposase-like protein